MQSCVEAQPTRLMLKYGLDAVCERKRQPVVQCGGFGETCVELSNAMTVRCKRLLSKSHTDTVDVRGAQVTSEKFTLDFSRAALFFRFNLLN